ncbi:MAG: hypothetical protein ACHQ50_11510 [Fimbriimonadales bacterium]
MSWLLQLGKEVTVERDGVPCGPPPNATVCVLLVGLASQGEALIARTSLAAELYPEGDSGASRNALRQSILRLRRWLGEDCLECVGDRVRLTPRRWSIEPDVLAGAKIPAPFLAAGVAHPWLDTLRERWLESTHAGYAATVRHYVAAVEGAADRDRDVGRALLAGGRSFSEQLTARENDALLSKTDFRDRRDPFALEHVELRAALYYRLFHPTEAVAGYMRAYSLANHMRNGAAQARTASFVAFCCIESGDMRSACDWLARVNEDRASASRLLVSICRAAYDWNSGQLEAALETTRAAIRFIPSTDRVTRVHFWSNYAAVAAEAGALSLSDELRERASEDLICDLDVRATQVLTYARGTRLMKGGEPNEAVEVFDGLASAARRMDWEATALYATDALAEAQALCGRWIQARQTWNLVHRARNGLLTPRLQARRARILGLCA